MSDLEVEKLVVFCRELRAHGLSVTPAEVVTAASALQVIDTIDRDEVFLGLRTVLTTSVDDFPVFEELFKRFWNRSSHKLINRETFSTLRSQSNVPRQTPKGLAFFLEHWGSSFSSGAQPVKVPGASDTESATTKDFSEFTNDELEEVSRLARRMVRRLARNPSRRWRPVRRGHRVNLRRSLRLSLKTGGELIELSYKERRPKRTKLVVLCDVSGSMDIYSRLLLQFVYGLQNSFAKVESFVFATSLARITGELKNKSYKSALHRLATNIRGWSGGTRIGASLAAFNAQWLRRIDKRTVIIILSDGWDTGDPEQLAASLSLLQRRAGRVIWLNPLLGSTDYAPMTRGMQASLPFIDVFAPAHDLASLRALEPHLVL
ncbi:MAG TPA: VWA domain-containing protein [Pyrinomonadaceae bacterium]|nr:VWA domain-containing protein [Pyrinomonadaceae bacterium]